MEEETKLLDLDGLTYYNGKIQGQLGDIQNDVDGKQATLVSGTNIKTINNTSLLGSGNISISSGQKVIFIEYDRNASSTSTVYNTEDNKAKIQTLIANKDNIDDYVVYVECKVPGMSRIFEYVIGGVYFEVNDNDQTEKGVNILFRPYTNISGNVYTSYGIRYKNSPNYRIGFGYPFVDRNKVYFSTESLYEILSDGLTSYPIGTNNSNSYTPSGDYNPATKKYVDDMVGDINSVLATLTTPTTPSI